MLRSRFASLLAVAAISVLAAVSATVTATMRAVRDTVAFVRDWVYSGLENLHQTPAGEISTKTTVQRVRAHAFVARLLKRDRPHVTSGWRMCPSV